MLPPPKRKKTTGPKTVKIYNKGIICLPHQLGDNVLIPIPRGDKRSKLAEMGLIGKIALHSVWQAAQVEAEVSSVFCLSVWSVTRRSIAVCLLEARRLVCFVEHTKVDVFPVIVLFCRKTKGTQNNYRISICVRKQGFLVVTSYSIPSDRRFSSNFDFSVKVMIQMKSLV